MRKLLLAALTLLTLSCATLTGLEKVYAFNAKRLEPEVWYEYVFTGLRACAMHYVGVEYSKGFHGIEWFVTPAGAMRAPNDTTVVYAGIWSPPNRIFLDERYVMDAYIVAHEMLHYLTGVTHGQPEQWAALEKACILGDPDTPIDTPAPNR